MKYIEKLLHSRLSNKLNFSKYHLTIDQFDFLIEFLKTDSFYESLNLSNHHLSDVEAFKLAEMLEHNDKLAVLKINDNNITYEGVLKILESININYMVHKFSFDPISIKENEDKDKDKESIEIDLEKTLKYNYTLSVIDNLTCPAHFFFAFRNKMLLLKFTELLSKNPDQIYYSLDFCNYFSKINKSILKNNMIQFNKIDSDECDFIIKCVSRNVKEFNANFLDKLNEILNNVIIKPEWPEDLTIELLSFFPPIDQDFVIEMGVDLYALDMYE